LHTVAAFSIFVIILFSAFNMDKVSIIVSGLEYKIKKIVDLQNETLTENKKLKQDIHETKHIIENQKVIINKLEEKIKVLKIAGTFEGREDSYQTKLKINELVREIDKCIALLNK
jgi:hypothetical protein